VVPYRLPELIEAIGNERLILIVEGEAKVDLLWSWNVAATCCPAGSKKWKPEHSEFLRGADVVILPDNDGPGREHADIVGASLAGIAKRVRVLALPGLGAKGDIIDWEKAGGTREQLDALLREARDCQQSVTNNLNKEKAGSKARMDKLLEALAKLPLGIDFHRQRRDAAKELGVPEKAIDAELKVRREKAAPLHGHWIIEPWHWKTSS
jgi:DNA primase